MIRTARVRRHIVQPFHPVVARQHFGEAIFKETIRAPVLSGADGGDKQRSLSNVHSFFIFGSRRYCCPGLSPAILGPDRSHILDLRLVRYFVAAAETEHLGRAAEMLHISQSPLSRQIRQFEKEVGMTLFHRERQRIRLTEDGRWLLEEARDLLARSAIVERNAQRRARGETGSISVGFVKAAIWNGLLPEALKRCAAVRPEARIELHNLTSRAQADALCRGELDLGFVHVPPADSSLLSVCAVEEPLLLAMPKDYELASKRAILPADLDGAPWIALPRKLSPEGHADLLAACARAGFTPTVRYEAADPYAILRLVEAGLGLVFLQASIRRATLPGVVFRELPWFPRTLRVYVVHQRVQRSGTSPLVREFVRLVENLREEVEHRFVKA